MVYELPNVHPKNFTVSIFPDVAGNVLREQALTPDSLLKLFTSTEREDKHALPLICFCRFGDKRTIRGSLRFDDNVEEIFALKFDHDIGTVSLDDAIDIFEAHNISGIIHSTPSSTIDHPRWHAFLWLRNPLRGPDLKQRAKEMFGMMETWFPKGSMSKETSAISQAFFFGFIEGRPKHIQLFGEEDQYIDDLKIKLNGHDVFEGESVLDNDFDYDKAIADIINGREFHTSINGLAMSMVDHDMPRNYVISVLEALMDQAPVHDRRFHERKGDIERSVDGAIARRARERFRKEKEEQLKEDNWLHSLKPEILDPRSILLAPIYSVEGLIQKGKVGGLIAGANTGKTTILIQLAIAHALGRDFLGRKVEKGKLVFISQDDSQDDLDSMLILMMQQMHLTTKEQHQVMSKVVIRSIIGLEGEMEFTKTEYGKSRLTKLVDHIIDMFKDDHDIIGIIFDTLDQFAGAKSVDEHAMRLTVAAATKIAMRLNIYILFVHHIPKAIARGEQGYDLYSGAGSAVIANHCRFIMTLMRHDGPGDFYILTPQRGSILVKKSDPLMLVREDRLFRLSGPADRFEEDSITNYDAIKNQILQILVETDEGYTKRTIIRRVTGGRTSILETLKRMEEEGLIEMENSGKGRPTWVKFRG